ncbi:MAG: site-specific DNA-methyltransferase [Candidatus Lokiarchaeota archaeon]
MIHKIIQGDCVEELENLKKKDYFKGIDLTFLDPPFNQDKEYNHHDDNMPEEDYWAWMKVVSQKIFNLTSEGGAIYFMQREKNTEFVLKTLRETGWKFQNLIAWNKLTSAIPSKYRFSKKYQIIAYFTKGKRPKTFNRLRYEPPLLAMHTYERKTGIYVTDIWDNVRELTSGYFAGDEAIRIKDGKVFSEEGERFHKQQSPIELLTRIILSSSQVGDFVLDPFAGSGVTAIVSKQLNRNSISIELDPQNVEVIRKRLELMRDSDKIEKFYSDYIYTENLDKIWYGKDSSPKIKENYKYKKIPKSQLNNIFLMKETIKSILIHEFNIQDNLIEFNYRLKDENNKIHRFELVMHGKSDNNIIFRLIYAKTQNQASYWLKRINYESKVIEEIQPNSLNIVILSGISFKNLVNDFKPNQKNLKVLPLPGWEKIYSLPQIKEVLNDLEIIKRNQSKKQTTLLNF